MKSFESYPSGPTGIAWTDVPDLLKTPLTIKGKSGLPLTIYLSPPDGRSVVEYLAVTDDNAFKIDNPKKSPFVLEATVVKGVLNVASFGLYSLSRLNSFSTHQGTFLPYFIGDNDRGQSTYPEFPYAQPDFFAKQFILGFLSRCRNHGTRIDYIQDLWNRKNSIIYDQFINLFDSKNHYELTREELNLFKIQCASQTLSANVYSEAGFHTIKNVIVDTQYNLSASAQFWP